MRSLFLFAFDDPSDRAFRIPEVLCQVVVHSVQVERYSFHFCFVEGIELGYHHFVPLEGCRSPVGIVGI
jgi:hypothetical protein